MLTALYTPINSDIMWLRVSRSWRKEKSVCVCVLFAAGLWFTIVCCLYLGSFPHNLCHRPAVWWQEQLTHSCATSVVSTLVIHGVPSSFASLAVQVLVAAAISVTDVVGLWYAISRFVHRNISNSHKFQAIGLGETVVVEGVGGCAWLGGGWSVLDTMRDRQEGV